jgi:NADPH2:quinone reductase
MFAMLMPALGEPRDLTLTELSERALEPSEVRIEVRAIGVNLADILIIQGKYQIKPPLPFAPGSEVAGTVREVGCDVSSIKVGDRVLAMLPFGGYATQVVAREAQVFRLPDTLTFDHAAAFTVVYHTSYFALVYRAPLLAGQTLLVHGAAGGVGLSAVQIGRALGARVLATAGSEDKRAFVRAQGAEQVFDSRSPDWVEQVLSATDGRGADHIYDPVGGDTFERSLKCIAFSGSLHIIGFASGTIPSCAMNRVLLKNISLVGLHWGAYQHKEPEKIAAAMHALFAMHERGQLAVHVSETLPLARAAEALDAIQTRKAQGKIVLTVE